MNFFDHKNLGNHLLQLCPKVVKHPVYVYIYMFPLNRIGDTCVFCDIRTKFLNNIEMNFMPSVIQQRADLD